MISKPTLIADSETIMLSRSETGLKMLVEIRHKVQANSGQSRCFGRLEIGIMAEAELSVE